VQVRPPAGTCPSTQKLQFASFEDLFAAERETSPEAEHYRAVVQQAINAHEESSGADIAACLMEPMLQGAGGMLFIDPLYQRVMINVRFTTPDAPVDTVSNCVQVFY
jgi:adenosylmethionine-8-amino-7-oxononanoate aminotransferase